MAIRPTQDNKEEFVQLPAGIIPANLNPEFWIARTNDVLGGPKIFNTLEEFITLSPNIMEVGMLVTINQHNRPDGLFPKTVLNLKSIPDTADVPLAISPNQLDGSGNEILDVDGNPIPNDNYYLNYYDTSQTFEQTGIETVFEYAPDINGLKPPYPYLNNPDAESSWTTNYDPATSKWLRSRNTDRQDPNTGIYLDWSIPLPINGNFESGDFLSNLFRRAATTPSLPKGLTKDGAPNNEPEGWSDVPPAGTDPLYEIRAQKDKYGNLKTNWIGPFLILEDEDLVRYNSQAVPNPNTLADNNTPATGGSQADIDLIDAGWVKTFDPTIHRFRAKREETSPSNYTDWDVVKIADESGEYIDRIYKLFPINTDFDSNTFIQDNTPTGNDPIANSQNLARNNGWSDTPLSEDDTNINAFSQARKFIDGSLKTTWSSPLPFTGKSTYIDYIRSNGENTFKYTSSTDTSPDPATITLEAFLFKGNTEVVNNLTYKWFKIYNNREAIAVDPVNDTPLSTSKTLTVSPSAVDTKAIFRCYTTLTLGDSTTVEFTEEESILDITDGDDAKNLTLSSETPIVLYDTNASAFSVDNIRLRAFQNFLDGTTFYWYKDDGAGNWVALSGNADYTLTNQTLLIATADLFTADGTKQNARFAISTSDTISNVEGVDEFYDIFTISKLSSAGVGAAGQDAYTVVLSDEVDNLVLDRATLLPQSGQLGLSGDVDTTINVYEGDTALTQGSGYTVSVTSPDNPDVTFGTEVVGDNIRVYLDTWTSTTLRKSKAVVTVTIVGSSPTVTLVKNFTVSTSLDTAGAVIPFIQVANDTTYNTVYNNVYGNTDGKNKAFSFTPGKRRDIVLEAVLDQNGTAIPASEWAGDVIWFFDNVNSGGTNTSGLNNVNKRIRRTDVTNNLSVKAKIFYKNNEYVTSPVTIDDITDAKSYRLYYNYASAFDVEANEPLALPSKPANVNVDNFESTYALSGASTDWYREAAAKTYFVVEGIVSSNQTGFEGIDRIVWQKPFRIKGERGDQGPTPDFIITYYKATESTSLPTLPANDATRNQMLNDGWVAAPALATGTYLYEASTTFNGTDVNDLDAVPTNNWKVLSKNPEDGQDGAVGPKGDKIEYRYQGNSTETFSGFVDNNRQAGAGWDTVKPAIDSFNYVYITEAYIDADNNLVGTWSTPVLYSVAPAVITESVLQQTSNKNQYLFENS